MRDAPMGSHVYDAGDLGCGNGLSAAFRRRLKDLTPGERLTVLSTDPAAREELPAMARLLGSEVESVRVLPDGRSEIRVVRR